MCMRLQFKNAEIFYDDLSTAFQLQFSILGSKNEFDIERFSSDK